MIPPAVSTFLKGYAMGAANVIPGVSGGTVAFITGIFETLVNALKSFDLKAIGHLAHFRFRAFWEHIHGAFLLPLGLGVVVSVASLAKLLGYLFDHHPVYIWALFFGLILASVYYVGKTVERWSLGPLAAFFIGIGIAAAIAMLKPASQNDGMLYLILCGVVGVCSMIVPGLSGSFVLILMGNYRLILDSLSDFVSAATTLDFSALAAPLRVMVPVLGGIVLGLVVFSHFISWLFRRFRDAAVGLLTGFVAGSLLIIWPWKENLYKRAADGELLLKKGGERIVEGYQWYFPELDKGATWVAVGLILLGAGVVILMETMAKEPVMHSVEPGVDGSRARES